jgi:hypothetical protein
LRETPDSSEFPSASAPIRAAPVYEIKIPPGYRDWRLISLNHLAGSNVSRSYEKQYKGRGPQGDEAHHTTHTTSAGTIAPKALRFRLRLSTSRYFNLDADGNDLHQPLGSPFP